jgi:Holliday junction resolvase RusA-like endonuclease
MIEFTLPGNVVPKARPRITRNGSFIPKNYRCWKTLAISRMKQQYQGETLQQAAVAIVLTGKHPRRGDLDNLSGSILDALVQAGILRDDNMTVVSSLSIRLEWDKKTEPLAIVRLTLPDNEQAIAA